MTREQLEAQEDDKGECARLQVSGRIAVMKVRNEFEVDWPEVLRIAGRPEYGNIKEVKTVDETAKALGKRSPYDSNE